MSAFQSSPVAGRPLTVAYADRDAVAAKLDALAETDREFLAATMENPQADESLLAGVVLYLDQASKGRFLNSLKLEKCGQWLGDAAPGRLQIRLHEIARQSQHPAFAAFRNGLVRSGGLERAYPKAAL